MFKNLTHAGLALALILPPLPLPIKTPMVKVINQAFSTNLPVINGYTVPNVPTTKVFSNTINGLTVTTTIANTPDQLTQAVVMQGQKETVRFQLALERRDTLTFDQFIFNQDVHDNKSIVTKEWIVAEKPNAQWGSTYTWRFLGGYNIVLEKLVDQSIRIIRDQRNKKDFVATIEPFVYWTKDGIKKNVYVDVYKNDNGVFEIRVNIHEPNSSYPLYVDPTISYGQWLGDGSAITANLPTANVFAIAVDSVSGEIYAGGGANGVLVQPVTIIGTNYKSSSSGYVVEITSANPPVINWMYLLSASSQSIVYALAVNGDEIYAGGLSGGTSIVYSEGVTLGTVSNSISEGFVVEIADGNPPSLEWRVWLGGDGSDAVNAIVVNGDEIYAGGYTDSSDSWETAGSTVGTLTNTTTNSEGFLVEIADGNPPILSWRMWLGGVGKDEVLALAINGDEIYAGGYSNSSASWETVGSIVGTVTNTLTTGEGYVVEIVDGSPPTLNWRMWLGGISRDVVYALAINGDEIYAGGRSDNSSTWDTASYVVGTYIGSAIIGEGYVVEINDGGPPTLAWLMWLGGSFQDQVFGIAVNGDEIYAAGHSNSSDSWDTAGTTVGTFTDVNNQEGFVVEISDGAPPTLVWRMWTGPLGGDQVNTLAINNNSIYIMGYMITAYAGSMENFSTISGSFLARSNNAYNAYVAEIVDGSPPTYSWFQWLNGSGSSIINALAVSGDEIYAGGQSYHQTLGTIVEAGTPNSYEEGFVVEILDGITPSLNWRQWLGGDGQTIVYALAVNGDEIYAGGVTKSSDSWDTAGVTFGTLTNSLNEGFVVEIADGNPPTLTWRMWLGGVGTDIIFSVAVTNDEIYVGGYSTSSDFWDTAGSIIGTLTNTSNEGFVLEINDGVSPDFTWHMWLGGSGGDSIYQVTVNGDEIYAGGYTFSSDSWDTAIMTGGTLINTNSEGFIVEIADGAPPSLIWRLWVGGDGNDYVRAVAVNENEIYVGGNSNSSDSWETFGITVGTLTNAVDEGFVVEITDGSPPTLTWLMWLGGEGVDYVYNLAVNDDEIYVSGYSSSINSWDTAISVLGTVTDSGNTEGFVVEIQDGITPSLNWMMWQGGWDNDKILALAINGEEIYVGGYTLLTADLEGVYQGTKYDGQNSAYFVEINDDSVAAAINALFLYMD